MCHVRIQEEFLGENRDTSVGENRAFWGAVSRRRRRGIVYSFR